METKKDKRLVIETIVFTALWITCAAMLYYFFK